MPVKERKPEVVACTSQARRSNVRRQQQQQAKEQRELGQQEPWHFRYHEFRGIQRVRVQMVLGSGRIHDGMQIDGM